MSESTPIDFSGNVSAQLPSECLERLRRELPVVFSQLCPNGPLVEGVFVSRLFKGYTQNFDERVILGLEVRYVDRYETHIVKVGKREKIKRDYDGWITCTKDRHVASRIFAPVQIVESLEDDRVAVVYRDAYTLFGLDQDQSRPRTLETVAGWAVQDDRPDPLSVERSIAQIYTDLGRWFFPGSQSDRASAASFYRKKLRIDASTDSSVLKQWREDSIRRELRRDAVWLTCGRDRPDADPVSEPARYLDPVDFVEWKLEASDGSRLPDTLVGRSHGDLHGRNILLGVRRGETEYPAVFDYEDMSDKNVLVWDFVKLETELKIRLLPYLYDQDEGVREMLQVRSTLGAIVASRNASSCPSYALERANRVAAFLAFEELLDDRTRRIDSRVQAERIRLQPCQLRTGVDKLDRLLAILLRIRKEAALWLGYEPRQRIHRWMDEYYFGLAVYGLLNVCWDYEPLQAECALIAAGVAAARMHSTPKTLKSCIVDCTAGGKDQKLSFPSYHVPLSVAHDFWKARQYESGREFLENIVRKNEAKAAVPTEEGEKVRRRRLEIHSDYLHAVPLIAEYALLETECDHANLAEPLLAGLRPQAVEFGDFETLGRIGRLFKDSGDRRWEDSGKGFEELACSPAWQMYQKALLVYEEAFLATNDYYTGINAATLAAITDDINKSRDYAAKVAEICSELRDIPREDRFWVFATEGEAAVILGRWTDAKDFYTNALAALTPGQGGMANSAYKQLRRLARAFEDCQDHISPILRLFEEGEFRSFLSIDMFAPRKTGTDSTESDASDA